MGHAYLLVKECGCCGGDYHEDCGTNCDCGSNICLECASAEPEIWMCCQLCKKNRDDSASGDAAPMVVAN